MYKKEDETCSQIVPNFKRGARTPFFSRVLTSLRTSSPIFRSIVFKKPLEFSRGFVFG